MDLVSQVEAGGQEAENVKQDKSVKEQQSTNRMLLRVKGNELCGHTSRCGGSGYLWLWEQQQCL